MTGTGKQEKFVGFPLATTYPCSAGKIDPRAKMWIVSTIEHKNVYGTNSNSSITKREIAFPRQKMGQTVPTAPQVGSSVGLTTLHGKQPCEATKETSDWTNNDGPGKRKAEPICEFFMKCTLLVQIESCSAICRYLFLIMLLSFNRCRLTRRQEIRFNSCT